jgi:hypothetical protein
MRMGVRDEREAEDSDELQILEKVASVEARSAAKERRIVKGKTEEGTRLERLKDWVIVTS